MILLKNGNYNFNFSWVKGGLNNITGAETQSNTLIRSQNFLDVHNFDFINLKILNSFNVIVFKYNSNYEFVGLFNNKNNSGDVIPYNKDTTLNITDCYFIKVIMANSSYSTEISVSDSINLNIFSSFNFNYDLIKNLILSFANFKGIDLTWYLGGLDIENGQERESTTLIRTDFINCNLAQKFKIDNLASSIMIFYYDKNKNFLSHTQQFLGKQGLILNIPQNCFYLRIILGDVEHDLSIQNGNLCFLAFLNNNYYKNKRLSILGDSISTYNGITPSDKANAFYPSGNLQNVNNTYWKLVQNALDLNLDVNNSYSSSTVSSPNNEFSSFCDDSRLENLGNPDIIIVEGGTNDIYTGKNSSDINSFDINHYDISKFSDAYAYVIRKLQSLYPFATIITLTPNFILNNNDFSRPNCTYQRINDICDNIVTLSNHLGAIPIDLRKAGINMSNITSCTIDGLHWNMLGHSLVANLIISTLLNLLK